MHKDVDVQHEARSRQEAFWTLVHNWTKQRLAGLLEKVLLIRQEEQLASRWNQRRPGRSDWRNGFYDRQLLSPYGPLSIRVPRCRSGRLDCSDLFDPYQRRVQDVDRILCHAFLAGTSTRATAELAEQIFGGQLSHQTVSNITRWLDEQLRAWRRQPLASYYRAVYIDGMHLDCRGGDRMIMLVMAAHEDGQYEVLGFSAGAGESCSQLLWNLRQRGLEHVQLFVSDDSAAVRAAIAEVFPLSAWQNCCLHRLMALRQNIGPADYRSAILRQAAQIFRCPSKAAALDWAGNWASHWRSLAPAAVQTFMHGLTDSLAFYSLPQNWWKRTRTNNPLERLIRTLRMRLRNISCFYDQPAAERAVFGQLARWHKIRLTHST